MPTAELLEPKRYNFMGHVWEKGVEVEVDEDTARILEDNPRFKVRVLSRQDEDGDEDEKKPAAKKAPAKIVKAKIEAAAPLKIDQIREAMDGLDPDNEDAYDADGKPDPEVLTKIVGFEVTQEDVDGILGVDPKPKVTTTAAKSKLKVPKKVEPKADDKDDPTTEGSLPVE